jgi:predicted Zn-dependent protease
VDTISIRADLRGTTFNIVVISDNQRNAFALPNGDIVLHAGLISDIKNEDELAGLIAHEMSHSILRHSSEVVSISDLARIPSGFLYSAVALTGTGPLSGLLRWLAVEMAQPERLLAELPTSRRLEKEADRVGIDLMVQSGYDANAVLEYWKRQPKSEKYLTVASSHPNNADRLQEIKQYLDSKQLSASNPPTRIKPEEDRETTLEYWIARISSQMKPS